MVVGMGGDTEAEQRARLKIDAQLKAAGWHVSDVAHLDLIHHPSCAVREVVMKPGSGRVDYLLYVDRRIVGVIEAKPEGHTLSGVEWQSAIYAKGLSAPHQLQAVMVHDRLPFVFEASGSEAHFTNGYDPEPRAPNVSNFPDPRCLPWILRDAAANPYVPTWRAKVRQMPVLDGTPPSPAQTTAVNAVEREPRRAAVGPLPGTERTVRIRWSRMVFRRLAMAGGAG